jgi:hypothetical protein
MEQRKNEAEALSFLAHESELLAELRSIVRRSLSRRVHRHYRGFALNQLQFLEKEPTAKKLLYVLRTALTGIHLLETGELEPDLTRIMDRYDLSDAQSLIERKRAGERVSLPRGELDRWRARVGALFTRLDQARDRSILPPEPPNAEEVRAWLLDVRRARFR